MSAFIVSDFHINALVTYGVNKDAAFFNGKNWEEINAGTAQEMAELLYVANVRNVNRLYGERTRTTGFKHHRVDVSHLTSADIVKACDCLQYQSEGGKGWARSRARMVLRAIREKAVAQLVQHCHTWALEGGAA